MPREIMVAFTVDDAKQAWARTYAGLGQEEIDRRVLGFAALAQGIADRGAVSPEEFGMERGIESSRAKQVFEGLATLGVQVDSNGNVVGAALTALETPHHVEVRGKQLYAWCALDTLFIPGLLGESAEVESKCPVSEEAIHLAITPEGVQEFGPLNAVISVVLPGVGDSSAQTGPASPT